MGKDWSVHNGKKFLAAMSLNKEVDEDDNLKQVFDALDRNVRHKMSVWVLSPHTEPNPDAFTFSR